MKRPIKQESQLLQSLKILSTILNDKGSVLEQHVLLNNNWAIAQNGIIAIGEPIQEDLIAAPNGLLFREALAKCREIFSLTQLPNSLSLKSGRFKALIPCLPFEDMQSSQPDPTIASIDDRLKTSLQVVSPITLNEENVIALSVLIDRGTTIATDKKLIIQYWHGIDLPPKLVLPKSLIKPLVSNPKKLTGFGYGKSSCTFHYEDNSWIKSQLFVEEWPDINRILDKKAILNPLPEDFYAGIEALEPFSENGFVFCDSNIMRSHEEEGQGASYEVYGLPKGPVLNIKQFKTIKPYIKNIDFFVPHFNHHIMIWNGENCRGAIAGRI